MANNKSYIRNQKINFIFVLIILSVLCGCQRKEKNTTKPDQAGCKTINSSLRAGDVFTFGRYEQDNNMDNGDEPIEWIVLSVEKDRALLISRYALETKSYNDKYNNVTWRISSLRKWLNNEFFNTSFNQEEKSCIAEIKNKNNKNPSSGTRGGLKTKDRVFLLSIDEAAKYFINDESRQCESTEFAKANGAYVGKNGKSWWWLRSSGSNGKAAAIVLYHGYVSNTGFSIADNTNTVRPALWIYISK